MKKLSIDKIVAIESLLNQLDILREFNLNEIVVIEDLGNDVIKQTTIYDLFGIEDLGVITLFKKPGIIFKRFDLTDVLKITQSWEEENVYSVMIKLRHERMNFLFHIVPQVVIVD